MHWNLGFHTQLPCDEDNDLSDNAKLIGNKADKSVRCVLCPPISFLLLPHESSADDGSVVKLTILPSLCKVFERC